MLHKCFPGHATVKDAAQGLAEVVVSAYGNVDHDGDIVIKGASLKQIAGDYGPNPKGLLDHDWTMKSAVAKTLRMWEEDDGLHIEAQYNLEKEIGRDAFSDLTFYGVDMEFSVGYQVKRSTRPDEPQKAMGARRIIEEWVINEWSGVMLGSNSDTRLVSAKSVDELTAHIRTIVDEVLADRFPVDEQPAAEEVAAAVTAEVAALDVFDRSVARYRLLVASTIL